MDFSLPLRNLYPNYTWSVPHEGDDYDLIVWDETNEIPKPPQEELVTEYKRYINERPMVLLREERDKLLTKSDIYTLPDYPHPTAEVRQAWLDYRQVLRDFPSTVTPTMNEFGRLNEVTWPTPPQ